MATIDFESLTKPVSDEAPCGEDLEMSGDLDYMNFVAGAEGLLPKSYFGKDQAGNEGRPFDRNSIDFESQFNAAKPFLDKTRDLRLIGVLAKFSILNRDFSGFIACVRAIAALLEQHWDDVHPRAEDGEYAFRMVSVESIEAVPTIILPLQFTPLIEHKRFGTMSYRTYLIGKGEVAPSEGESAIDLSSVEKILQEVELPILTERRQQAMELDTAVKQIRTVWMDKCPSGPSVSLERLATIANEIFNVLNGAVVKRDPNAGLAIAGDGEEGEGAGAIAITAGQISSGALAARALAAVAAYFGRCEPSSPALMLVRQAQDLLGKSFLEVIQLLIPDQVNLAAVNIGRDQFFGVPIERLASAAGSGQDQTVNDAGADSEAHFDVQTRSDALTLLDQVGVYFRAAEPSSPIPFFTERARDLANRDFLSVLKVLLPPDTLKTES